MRWQGQEEMWQATHEGRVLHSDKFHNMMFLIVCPPLPISGQASHADL